MDITDASPCNSAGDVGRLGPEPYPFVKSIARKRRKVTAGPIKANQDLTAVAALSPSKLRMIPLQQLGCAATNRGAALRIYEFFNNGLLS